MGITYEITYKKGETASIKIGDGISRTFTVKKPFKLLGYQKDKIIVEIPVTLETLRGLGYIKKIKEKRG